MSAPSTTKIGDTHEHRKKLWRLIYRGRTFHGPALTFALLLITVGVTGLLTKFVIWPGYLDPQARIYTSRLGHAAVMRRQGHPFPVTTTFPATRTVSARFLGEGLIRSEPILVPIVPMGRIKRVYVTQGERVQKGQLLAELHDRQAWIKHEAAKAALAIANAELARIKIGSVHVLEHERPEREEIRVTAARDTLNIKQQLDEMAEKLYQQRLISKQELLRRKMENVENVAGLREATLSLEQSREGREQSVRIAELAVYEAKLAVDHRRAELDDYKIYAPADGLIERCLIHEGEYNQDPGKPAFLLASGQWFEAYFDQTAIGEFQVGDEAVVHLEAFAGEVLTGTVSLVDPIVTYKIGGPETTRPIRPQGTGTPEWPSTFSVRIALDDADVPVTVGLTGFARIQKSRDALAVPKESLVSVSAAQGIAYVVTKDTFGPRKVSLGYATDDWIEVRGGLDSDDEIIVKGHQVLQAGDRITKSDSNRPNQSTPLVATAPLEP